MPRAGSRIVIIVPPTQRDINCNPSEENRTFGPSLAAAAGAPSFTFCFAPHRGRLRRAKPHRVCTGATGVLARRAFKVRARMFLNGGQASFPLIFDSKTTSSFPPRVFASSKGGEKIVTTFSLTTGLTEEARVYGSARFVGYNCIPLRERRYFSRVGNLFLWDGGETFSESMIRLLIRRRGFLVVVKFWNAICRNFR